METIKKIEYGRCPLDGKSYGIEGRKDKKPKKDNLKLRYDLAMKKISYLVSPDMYIKFKKDVDEFIKSGKKQTAYFFKNEF